MTPDEQRKVNTVITQWRAVVEAQSKQIEALQTQIVILKQLIKQDG